MIGLRRRAGAADLRRLGFVSRSEDFWRRAPRAIDLVIIAPPVFSIPSPEGQAIYVLVERMAELLPFSTVVLARWPDEGIRGSSPIDDRLLYYRPPLTPGLRDRLPHRIKKAVWGTGAPVLLTYARAAARACRALGPRVVMVEDVPFVAKEVRRRNPGVRIILHQHAPAPTYYSRRRWRSIAKGLDELVFVSRQARAESSRRHGDLGVRARVILNGVSLEHYDPERVVGAATRKLHGISEDQLTFLFVGRVVPYKGPVEAVEAFEKSGLRDARFLVVGDLEPSYDSSPEYVERLRSLARLSAGRVILVGTVPQSAIPEYYAAADAVVVPSIGPEGLPKVITEALAMRRPVLASDRGGSFEVLREGVTGWRLPNPADSADLALRLRIFAESGVRRIAEADRDIVSEERMIREFTRLVEGLKNGR